MSLALKITPLPVGEETGKYDDVKKQYKGLLNVTRQWEVEGGKEQSAEWLLEEARSLFDAYGTKDGETTNTTFNKNPDNARYVFPNVYLEEQGVKSRAPDSSSAILTKVYQEAYSTFREIAKPVELTDDRDRKTVQRTMVILNGSGSISDSPGTPDEEFPDLVYNKQVVEIGNAVTIVKRDYVQATSSLEEIGEAQMSIDDNGRKQTIRTYTVLNSAGQATIDGTLGTPDYAFTDQVYVSQVANQNGLTTTIRRTFLEATNELEQVGGDVFDRKINGLVRITRSYVGLVSAPIGDTDVGVDTITYGSKDLYLADVVESPNETTKVISKIWMEPGILSVRPIRQGEFSVAPSYTYVTFGVQASSMTGLNTPSGDPLGTDVTWFEPSIENFEGLRSYSQDVLATDVDPGSDVLVDSYDKFFTVTDPGIMSTGGSYNIGATSGGATRYPKAISQPKTYRKKARVKMYLTESSEITETEVAYNESLVDWCSIAFDSFYNNETDSAASVSSNWRSFPKYLNSEGTTDTSYASTTGVYFAQAQSFGAGSESYLMTGIYRVELDKYQKRSDSTQLYIKTVIEFL